MADEFEKQAVGETEEGSEDVEAHKNAIQKNALQKDESDDDTDVEAHKNAIQKTAIQ
jgi:cold shock CspA family protein